LKEKACAPAKKSVLVQASKMLPDTSPFYGVNPSVGGVLEMFSISEKMKW
jgi:hypothetical protein